MDSVDSQRTCLPTLPTAPTTSGLLFGDQVDLFSFDKNSPPLQEYEAALGAITSKSGSEAVLELLVHLERGKELTFDAGKLYDKWRLTRK